MKALKKVVAALVKMSELDDSWPRSSADCIQFGQVRFTYISKTDSGKAVFKVQLLDQKRFAMLKIAQTYRSMQKFTNNWLTLLFTTVT